MPRRNRKAPSLRGRRYGTGRLRHCSGCLVCKGAGWEPESLADLAGDGGARLRVPGPALDQDSSGPTSSAA